MSRHVISPLHACSFDLSADEYQTRFDELNLDGYRLIFVDGFRTPRGLRYGGIWLRDRASVLTAARHGLTSSEYQEQYDDLRGRGYVIEGITGLSAESGKANSTFAAVWKDGSFRGHHTHHGMTVSDYQSKFDQYAAAGYRLIYITGYAENDASRYAAIWFTGGAWPLHARHNLPAKDYQSTYDALKADGYRIAHVNAHEAGGATYFAGIWVKHNGYEPQGRHNLSLADGESTAQDLASIDYRLTSLSCYREDGQDKCAGVWVPQSRTCLLHGRADASLTGFDAAVQSFMQVKANTIPGAQLAVTRNGKLVLARGYSWITDIEAPVEPTSLFRLASVSKTLTGAAIVRLAEDGKLSLRDKVVDLIDMPGAISDPEINDIRVEHLLYHVGGWDRRDDGGSGIDPVSNDLQIAADLGIDLPITNQVIMKWMNENYVKYCIRKNHSLDFTPGTVDGAVYCNYGYMLLGQIVETIAGMAYEDFVATRLLLPLGIRRMRLGRTLLRSKLPDEVLYHTSKATNYHLRKNVVLEGAPINAMEQYGGHFSMENHAANGGWLGSAVDLVRFASTFDDPACPIFSAASIATIFAKHAYVSANIKSFDTCGWFVQLAGANAGQVKTGSFAGTAAMVDRWQDARTGDKFTAALLFNKDEGDADWDRIGLVREAARSVVTWPNSNYWSDYF
jgi:CubicO group peptidase (beta-lactamase class C family)